MDGFIIFNTSQLAERFCHEPTVLEINGRRLHRSRAQPEILTYRELSTGEFKAIRQKATDYGATIQPAERYTFAGDGG